MITIDNRLKDLQGIIWDLDNTLYRAEEALLHAFNLAIARVAIDSGAPLTLEEAVAMARKCYEKTGYSGACFIEHYGIDRETLHHEAHKLTDETIIKKSAEVANLFKGLSLGHALITHGARDWAMRVLLHLDVLHWFPHERIFAFENYNFQSKSESTMPFEMALSSLGLDAQHVLMVEDNIVNLKIPHRMGMGTILLTHGRKIGDAPAYVDMVCDNAGDVLRKINAIQGKPGA